MTTVAPLGPGDPERLGPYELTGRLGEGGMGTVYLGIDTRTDSTPSRVAVKAIRPKHARDARFRARFRREVAAARRVARFCTAPVLDADVDGDPPYVVTEYIEGRSLQDAVEKGGPLASSALEAVAVSVASALVAIHAAGIVHRDLKPSNVLLSEVGPRVIDFGVAGGVDFTSGLTGTGLVLGTPAFMAPEQLGAGGTVTAMADVFAWGCLIAYAGTGRTPFAADNLIGLAWQIAQGEPDLDGLDPGLRRLVSRALAKDPSARPSARELLADLLGEPTGTDAVPTAEALLARSEQALHRPPRPPRQPLRRPRRRAIATLALVGACALGLVAVVTVQDSGGLLRRVLNAGRADGQGQRQATTGPTPTATPGSVPRTSVTDGPLTVDPLAARKKGPTSGRVRADRIPKVMLQSWEHAGGDRGCLPLVPTVLGAAEGATPRLADRLRSKDTWSVAYDKPGLPGRDIEGRPCPTCGRGVFGIMGTSTVAGEEPEPDWPNRVRWLDGSTAVSTPVELEPGVGLHDRAIVRVAHQRCAFEVWTFLGPDHLGMLLDGLRLARSDI